MQVHVNQSELKITRSIAQEFPIKRRTVAPFKKVRNHA